MLKRVLSLVTAFILTLSLVPFSFADGALEPGEVNPNDWQPNVRAQFAAPAGNSINKNFDTFAHAYEYFDRNRDKCEGYVQFHFNNYPDAVYEIGAGKYDFTYMRPDYADSSKMVKDNLDYPRKGHGQIHQPRFLQICQKWFD